ncbi:MAG: amidohydrolase [Anaerolineales bacterium]
MKVFYNAKIYTPEPTNSTALVIDHGYIIALGYDKDILNGFHQAEQLTNVNNKTIWPGLTDAHVHLQTLAESLAMVDCETPSISTCLARVEKRCESLPRGAWVRGHGWNQNEWEGGYGTIESLDEVTSDHPAYLTAKSLHAAWVNSKALALAGIDQNTPDPPTGKIQRDSSGEPTGILFEMGAMSMVEEIIPRPSQTEILAMIDHLLPELWKMGLVGIHDFDGFDCWQALQAWFQQGNRNFRIRKNIPFDHLDTFIRCGLRTDFGNDWLHLGGVKLFSDGALGPQTAAMFEPYEGSDDAGSLLLSEDQIVQIGQDAISHGIALSIHAIGDQANHVVLNAYEKLRKYEQIHHLHHFRHRIEHVQIIQPQDLPRLAELDIIASVQPVHAPSDMIMADRYLGQRAQNAYAFRAIIDCGAPFVLGSDAPVESVNPFIGIHAAVTRQRLDGTPRPSGWHPQQRLSLNQALQGFSLMPAIASNRSDRMGKIAPGYTADFLILADDPFQITPDQLSSLKPEATFIGGECVYFSPETSLF